MALVAVRDYLCRVVAVTGPLVIAPLLVWQFADLGLAGAWRWLPVCLLTVVLPVAVWTIGWWGPERHRRLIAGGVAAPWACLVLSVAYWPNVVTRADLHVGIEAVAFDGADVVVHGLAICTPGMPKSWCPQLAGQSLVPDGQWFEILGGIEQAGFGPVVDGDCVGAATKEGTGFRYFFYRHGLRLTMALVTEREFGSERVPVSGDRVILVLTDRDRRPPGPPQLPASETYPLNDMVSRYPLGSSTCPFLRLR
jgi:hypothetical protein